MHVLKNGDRIIMEDHFGWRLMLRDGDSITTVGTVDKGSIAERWLLNGGVDNDPLAG